MNMKKADTKVVCTLQLYYCPLGSQNQQRIRWKCDRKIDHLIKFYKNVGSGVKLKNGF
jgi:hypothetical protein